MAQRELDLILKTSKQGTALEDGKKGLGGLNDAFSQITGVSMGAAGAIAAVGGALKFAIEGAIEAERIQADLNATLASTKGVAGLTADEINNMATGLANMTGIEDDAIVKGQAMLLTFTNIGRDVFPAATEAMLNMTAKFGSMDAASVQLGKALNDPIAGVTALRKVGVQLTDAQEAQIKKFVELGDVASAQKVILGELQTEFGGLAKAMGDTTEGKFNKLKNSIGNLAETIGGALLPVLGDAADALNLLFTAGTTVNDMVKKEKENIILSTKSYKEYVDTLVYLELVRQGMQGTDEQKLAFVKAYKGNLDLLTKTIGGVSDAEYEGARAADADAKATAAAAAAQTVFADELNRTYENMGGNQLAYETFLQRIKDVDAATRSAVNDALKPFTAEMLNQKVMATLSGDALLVYATKTGQLNAATYATITGLQGLTAQFDANKNGMIDAGEQTAAYWQQLSQLMGLDVTVTLGADYSDWLRAADAARNFFSIAGSGPGIMGGQFTNPNGTPTSNAPASLGGYSAPGANPYAYKPLAPSSPGPYKPPTKPVQKPYAEGGSFVIPGGYPNDTYPLGPYARATSGETVTVTPKGGGGMIDYVMLARVIRDAILQVSK
jgi:hypothetical protein